MNLVPFLYRLAIIHLGNVALLLWSSGCHVLVSFFASSSPYCGLDVVCDCGISWSYSLTIWTVGMTFDAKLKVKLLIIFVYGL